MQQCGFCLGCESACHFQGLCRCRGEIKWRQHPAVSFLGRPFDYQHRQAGERQQARGGRADEKISAIGPEHQQVGIDNGRLVDDRRQQLAAGQVEACRHAMQLSELGRKFCQRFLCLFAQLCRDLAGFLAEQFAQFVRGSLAQRVHQGQLCAHFSSQAKRPIDSRSCGIHQVGGRKDAGG
jgi:hypothetical protein